jgi:hypothetical protein
MNMKTTKSKETVTQPSLEAYALTPEICAAIAAADAALARRKDFDDALDRNFEEEAKAVLEYEAAKKAWADCEAELAICITAGDALKKEEAAVEAKKVAEQKRDAAERFSRLRAAIENKCSETDTEIDAAQDMLKAEVSKFTVGLRETLEAYLKNALEPLARALMFSQAFEHAVLGRGSYSTFLDANIPNPCNHLQPLLSDRHALLEAGRIDLSMEWRNEPTAEALYQKLHIVSDTTRKLASHSKFAPRTAKQRQDAALARNKPPAPAAPEVEWQPPKSTWNPGNINPSKGAARADRQEPPSRIEPQEGNMGAVLAGDIK